MNRRRLAQTLGVILVVAVAYGLGVGIAYAIGGGEHYPWAVGAPLGVLAATLLTLVTWSVSEWWDWVTADD